MSNVDHDADTLPLDEDGKINLSSILDEMSAADSVGAGRRRMCAVSLRVTRRLRKELRLIAVERGESMQRLLFRAVIKEMKACREEEAD